MKNLFKMLLLGLSFSATAQADPQSDASAVFESFLSGLSNLEMEKVVGLFSEDVMFWGTSTQTLATDISGVQAYFSALSSGVPGQNVASAIDYSVKVLNDELVLLSGTWKVDFTLTDTQSKLRVSMALALQDGQWKIVQFHNSNMPE